MMKTINGLTRADAVSAFSGCRILYKSALLVCLFFVVGLLLVCFWVFFIIVCLLLLFGS